MFKRCLICTDFNDGLYRLASYVPSLAASGLTYIVFVHSVPYWQEGEIPHVDEEKIKIAKQRLSKALENVPEGVEVQLEVPSGRAKDTIPRVIEQYSIDVVLTGTPVRSLLQEKVVGSTSLNLARATSAPLMILRPNHISVYTQEELELRCQHLWRSLLIPYNDSETAQYLLSQIKGYIQQDSNCPVKECLLVWVIREGGRMSSQTMESRKQQAENRLADVKPQLEYLGVQVKTQVRVGEPFVEIINAVLAEDVSAIAVGSDDRSGLLQWTTPSLAKELLRSSWYPLLFFSQRK